MRISLCTFFQHFLCARRELIVKRVRERFYGRMRELLVLVDLQEINDTHSLLEFTFQREIIPFFSRGIGLKEVAVPKELLHEIMRLRHSIGSGDRQSIESRNIRRMKCIQSQCLRKFLRNTLNKKRIITRSHLAFRQNINPAKRNMYKNLL